MSECSKAMAHTLQHQIIARALDIISDREHWVSGTLARQSDGSICFWGHPYAYRYCAMGALARAAMEILGESRVAKRLTGEVAEHVLEVNNRQFERLPTINDTEGHRVIVAMFEKALPA